MHGPGGGSQRVLVGVGIGVGSLAVIAVLAFLLLGKSPSASQAADGVPVSHKARVIIIPVEQAQQTLLDDVGDAKATGSSLARIRQDAEALSAAVATAQSSSDALVASSPPDSRTIVALRHTLIAEAALASYLTNAPTRISGYTHAFTAGVTPRAQAVSASARSLQAAVHGADLTLPVGAFSQLSTIVAASARQAEMRSFLGKMENFFSQSATGRSQIVSAIAQTQNDCEIPPDQAAQQISEVASNRQSLLDQVSALTVPQSAVAQQITSLFQQSLQASIQADDDYAAWMTHVFNYYYRPPQGCLGMVPTDQNYSNAVTVSGQASSLKAQLAAIFDRAARKFGLAANWDESNI